MVLSSHTLNVDKLAFPEVVNRKHFRGQGPFVPYRFDQASDVPDFLPIGADKPVRFTTSMHDEYGYLTKMPSHVERKLIHLEEKITQRTDEIVSVKEDLEKGAESLLIAYGINAALCREVVEKVRGEGKKCSLLIIESLFPVPARAIARALDGVRRVILPEMNLSLYAHAIEHAIPLDIDLVSLPKIDGELLTVDDVITKGDLM
jgi:2-oxoglutarate ferredoxin oxidoreductase subunit alpha